MNPTKAKLLTAAAESLREDGIAGLSARAIASRAGVNQALVFYHFGTLTELVVEAVRQAVAESAGFYRDQLASVRSLTELLALGRELHQRERDLGNVAMMAQLMSGAQQDPALAEVARYAMRLWSAEIEIVVRRVVDGSPVAQLADPVGLARAISAGFIGLELYEGVDPDGGTTALDALERLGVLVDVMNDLGPLATRALQAKLRRNRRD
jgi:AcrR family transcriptional regulator